MRMTQFYQQLVKFQGGLLWTRANSNSWCSLLFNVRSSPGCHYLFWHLKLTLYGIAAFQVVLPCIHFGPCYNYFASSRWTTPRSEKAIPYWFDEIAHIKKTTKDAFMADNRIRTELWGIQMSWVKTELNWADDLLASRFWRRNWVWQTLALLMWDNLWSS